MRSLWRARRCCWRRALSSAPSARVLNAAQEQLVADERALLDRLPAVLASVDASAEHRDLVADARKQLDELFMMVVVGEFNSGKSTTINALLGRRLLEDGVTPTTSQISVLKYGVPGQDYGAEDARYTRAGVIVHRFDVAWLRDINIVDTPGTNAVYERHQQLTEQFVPRADLVVFITSADRPFSASERAFLQLIRGWKRQLFMVVNKMDLLAADGPDRAAVLEFVNSNARELFAADVPVFPVSSRARLAGSASADATGFAALERYIFHTLAGAERAAIKLGAPLAAVSRVLGHYAAALGARAATLDADARALARLDAQLLVWGDELRRELQLHLVGLTGVLLRMEQRANAFLEQRLRLGNLYELLAKRDAVRAAFEHDVAADMAAEVERHLGAVADWLVERSAKQYDATLQTLRTSLQTPHAPTDASSFVANRQALLGELNARAERALASGFDKRAVGEHTSTVLRQAALSFAALELGAVGLSTVLSVALLDMTGVLGVGALAATGVAVLPYRKRQLRLQMGATVEALRVRLAHDVEAEFDRHLLAFVGQMRAAASPYSVYVKTEGAALAGQRAALADASAQTDSLMARVVSMKS